MNFSNKIKHKIMETRKISAVIILAVVLSINAFSQNIGIGINADGAAPAGSAILDVSSTTKGFLPPRMTYAQKAAIAGPVAGLMVYCTNCGTAGELQVFNGTTWTNVIGSAAAAGKPDAPTIGTATAGAGQATVAFTQPASNGGFTISSYTATSSPGNITGMLSQAGSGTITVTGLTIGTVYTFTVTATTVSGTGPASAASNSVRPVAPPIVGAYYQGGYIFYIFVSGDPGYVAGQTHGLIAAPSDQSKERIQWAVTAYQSQSVPAPGATGTAIGTGLTNTNAIVTQNRAGSTYAAGLARAYQGEGYKDWYLPSKDELNKLYLQKTAVGGFASGPYWSSSEYYYNVAWRHHFANGIQFDDYRSSSNYVRAVRTF
jgi:hypothetical protein